MLEYVPCVLIIYGLIVFTCVIVVISEYIEPLNSFLYDIKSIIYKLNDYEIIKQKFKSFNIKIYNDNEIEKYFINISKTLIENITIEKNYKLLEKEFFLLKILKKQFQGNSTFFDAIYINKIYNYEEQNFNNSNNVIFYFYKGLNESSKKDILILEKRDIFSNNIEYFISYLNDNNLIIDLNNKTNLFRIKFSANLLYDNKINNINKYNETIEIISKIYYYNLSLNQNNFNISSINISDYKLLIMYHNFKSILILSKNNKYSNSTNLNITKLEEINYFNNKNITKINFVLVHLLLILFSIINIIYIKKFKILINENNFHSISLELILLNANEHLFYFLDVFPLIKNFLYLNEYIFKKLFLISSHFFFIINIIYEYKFFLKNIEYLIDEADNALPFFRFLPNIILLILKKYNLDYYFMWLFQIGNNIIFNNKYTLPLFYIIFFTIDKLLFIINKNAIENYFSIIKILIFISLSIIIIYLQALFGPRFMLNSKYEEKNEKYYLSKKELIKQKPKSLYETCPICLIPIFDKSKIKKNNEQIFKDNNNILMQFTNKVISEIKDDTFICKEFMKRIIKIGFFDFYEYDDKFLKKYMLIPCGHFFHSSCLEKWINVENNCPLCRKNIPNLN